MKTLVPANHTFFHRRNAEKKDEGTICTIGGSDSEGERQGKGETSTSLMAIGDIKQWGGGWQHLLHDECVCEGCPHTTRWHFESSSRPGRAHAATNTHTHTRKETRPQQARSREDFTSHFPARCHVKYAIARGEEETWGHFVWEVYASFVSQHTPHTQTHTHIHTHTLCLPSRLEGQI